MNTVRCCSRARRSPMVWRRCLRSVAGSAPMVTCWAVERNSAPVSSFLSTPSHGAFTVRGHEAATYGVGGLPGLETLPLPAFVKRKIAKRSSSTAWAPTAARGRCCEYGHLCVEYDPRKEPIYDEVRAAFRVLANESGDQSGHPKTAHGPPGRRGARECGRRPRGRRSPRTDPRQSRVVRRGRRSSADGGWRPPGPRDRGVGTPCRRRNRGRRLAQATGSRIPTMRARCDRATRIRQPKSRPAS